MESCRDAADEERECVDGDGRIGVRGVSMADPGDAETEPLGSLTPLMAFPLPLFFERTYCQPCAFSMCCLQLLSRFDVYGQLSNRHL